MDGEAKPHEGRSRSESECEQRAQVVRSRPEADVI